MQNETLFLLEKLGFLFMNSSPGLIAFENRIERKVRIVLLEFDG